MKKILSILILLLSNVAVAQHVTDVDAYQLGDKIIIEYAISGPENPSSGGRYSVVPSFSVDGGRNYTALKSISGDLMNVNVGRGKRIEWRVLDEYDSFVHPRNGRLNLLQQINLLQHLNQVLTIIEKGRSVKKTSGMLMQ